MNRRGGEKKKTTFQTLEGEALDATLPLVTTQSPHAAAGGVAEVSAEGEETCPRRGAKGGPELTSEASREPQHRCSGR